MIENLWPTPVLTDKAPWSDSQIEQLRVFAVERFKNHKANPPEHSLPDVGVKLRVQLNLFHSIHEALAPSVWIQFRHWVDKLYRSYLAQAHGLRNAEELLIEARCIPVHYQQGMRAQPHYHHTCDHVLCLYLDCGHDRRSPIERDWTVGDGELILQDPRPMAGFPFWEKLRHIETYPGLVVIHPSRVWHESNPFNAQGTRTLLVVTLRVASHNYCELYCNLSKSEGDVNATSIS